MADALSASHPLHFYQSVGIAKHESTDWMEMPCSISSAFSLKLQHSYVLEAQCTLEFGYKEMLMTIREMICRDHVINGVLLANRWLLMCFQLTMLSSNK